MKTCQLEVPLVPAEHTTLTSTSMTQPLPLKQQLKASSSEWGRNRAKFSNYPFTTNFNFNFNMTSPLIQPKNQLTNVEACPILLPNFMAKAHLPDDLRELHGQSVAHHQESQVAQVLRLRQKPEGLYQTHLRLLLMLTTAGTFPRASNQSFIC